jgi:hypothetical protein
MTTTQELRNAEAHWLRLARQYERRARVMHSKCSLLPENPHYYQKEGFRFRNVARSLRMQRETGVYHCA